MPSPPDQPAPVTAAGGVVLRRGDRDWEVVLVHRPRYDDWTLPKGKLDPGESFVVAAVREVEEETGLRCRTLRELPAVAYEDASGRPKLVRYWTMAVRTGAIADREPDTEVDRVRWVGLDEARELLTYERDRALLEHLRSGRDHLPY